MPTIIDELIVTLGIDGKALQRDAAVVQKDIDKTGRAALDISIKLEQSLKKTQEATNTRMKQTAEVGRQSAGEFTKFRNELVAVFTAMAAGFGFKKFIENIASSDAAMGRLSARLNVAPGEMAAWQVAATRMGGSAEATSAAFVAMANDFNTYKTTGQSEILPWLNTLGVAWEDAAGKMRPINEIMLDIAKSAKFQALSLSEQTTLLSHVHIDPGLTALLSQGPSKVQVDLNEARSRGVPDEAAVQKAIKFEQDLLDIMQQIKHLGREVFGDLLPDIDAVIQKMEIWYKENGPWLRGEFHEKYREIRDDIVEIAEKIDNVVTAIGGWSPVIMTVAALWIGRITGITGAVTGLLRLLLLLPGGGILAAGAAAAAGLAIYGDTPDVKRPDNEKFNGDYIGHEGHQAPFMNLMERYMPTWLGGRGGGAATGGASDKRKAGVRDRLSESLGINTAAASGIVSNLNAESGIEGINEKNPTVPGSRGGFGWAQWTGPRRIEMESYAKLHGLDPSSDDANYGFLVHEMTTNPMYAGVLAQLRSGRLTPEQAAMAVAKGYIVPPESTIGGHVAGAEGIAKLPGTPKATGAPAPTPTTAPPASAPVAPFFPALSPSAIDPSLMKQSSLPGGATLAMAGRGGGSTDNSRNVETNVNSIHITTQATDTDEIAKTIQERLNRYAFVGSANSGLA